VPFGGVGHLGMGAYHGKLSFDIFRIKKALEQTWLTYLCAMLLTMKN
jgi:aldehyde dehydrogenase (NAD+)